MQAPTTLLAMVDAAIGGKTAVNLPEGKNLVGAFHQPRGVVADIDTLASLPAATTGPASARSRSTPCCPKAGRSRPSSTTTPPRCASGSRTCSTELVAACVEVKAAIVASDPEERTGARAVLNYGHTLAHTLETTGGYSLTHGEAVAVGLVFAARSRRSSSGSTPTPSPACARLLDELGLPTRIPGEGSVDDLLAVMARDKKSSGGLTFVLPGPTGLTLVDDPPRHAIEQAMHAVGVEG